MAIHSETGPGPTQVPLRDLQDDAGDAARSTKAQAGEMWDGAKERARSTLNQQKDSAAAGMDDVAAALRDAAQRRGDGDGDGDDTFARLSGAAADGLERLSGTLRNKDVGAMLRDVDAFARSQPLAFFGLAMVAGFVAVRFMKASNH